MNKQADIRWLAVGAVAGLVAAGIGILRQATADGDLPADVIASVNDTMIGQDVYDRALARVTTRDLSNDDRGRLIERLVDEELLVQRGVELGMTQSDTEVRATIVNSLVASITAEADAANPDDETLQAYLDDNADRFSYTSGLQVEAWQTDVEPLAQSFVSTLRETGEAIASEGIEALPDLRAELLSVEELRDHLGPAITAAAAEMPDGSSAVFARRGRWLVVRVIAKERGYVSDLGPIRNRVLLDYRRNLADSMLRDYLDGLRDRADIRIAAP